jgi:Adenylate and Guanylate cyclase catalytic domain/zinc-ribbon domain
MIVCPSCGEENPERARFCLACGNELADTPPIGEERKVVSVLFVDLVGFTDRSDRADPEDVRATLRPYHERVKADIEGYGGTVEKFIGDAVMAVFGAPIAHEDDAERAVRAALRILETMETLRGEGLDVAVRGAVSTGEAVVALGARPERGEGIVAGDVVGSPPAKRRSGWRRDRRCRHDAVDRGRDRVRGARRCGREGQAGTHTRVAGGCGAEPFRGRYGASTRLALRRAGLGANVARGDVLPRAARAVDTTPDCRRRTGCREEPARLGVQPRDRPAARSRALAPGPLPSLRRGDHVLGTRRDREGRGRRARDGLDLPGFGEARARCGARRGRVRSHVVHGTSRPTRRSPGRGRECRQGGGVLRLAPLSRGACRAASDRSRD